MSNRTGNGNFQFVLIPAETKDPIEAVEADGSGGLTDDALVKYAKNYFFERSGAKNRIDVLDKASPQERKLIAQQIRSQLEGGSSSASSSSSKAQEMDDDTLLDMLYRNQSAASCDITAVTIPTPLNQHNAVSLYAADQAKDLGWPLNSRAIALMTACGYSSAQVYGNVFVGRTIDNEIADIWQRVDFTVEDASPMADWCKTARTAGGGGGSGAGKASSLSSILQQQQQQTMGGGVQLIDNNQAATAADSGTFGANGAPAVVEPWGTWTQTDTEVELVLPVPPHVKAKHCAVKFARSTLSVAVSGEVRIPTKSQLFDPIVPDESTFTFQQQGSGKEMCITLTKAGDSPTATWPWVVAVNP